MNLKQTIAELDKQAAQYTQAANALRALLDNGVTAAVASGPKAVTVTTTGKAGKRKKSKVSEETRAKISKAMKARYAARKAEAK